MAYDRNFLILSVSIFALVMASFFLLEPQVQGDSISYLEAVNFLEGGIGHFENVAHRVITTFGGLWFIIILSKLSGSLLGTWFAMNAVFYALSVFVFYKTLRLLFGDRTALLGSLFFAGNYALLTFGLNFLMDMGGWFFYITSIYFLLKYAKFEERKHLLLASFFVGIGGLFKEYAFLPIIPIAIFIIFKNRKSLVKIIQESWLPAILAITPILTVYLWIFICFDYTYFDWLAVNGETYVYSSRAIEYIKSFGSLLNVLGVVFVAGVAVLSRKWNTLDSDTKLFLASTFISFLPVFIWPAITQRVLFVSTPFVIFIGAFALEKYKEKNHIFMLLFLVYLTLNLMMDSIVLNFVNLPI